MAAAPPTRAEIFQALAQDPDIPAVCRRFGIAREELSRLFGEAAALFKEEKSAAAEKPAVAGTWRLQVDGGSRGNPGPAGAGAVLFDPAGEKKGEVSQYLGETTNNVAEYQALLLGLKMALDLGVTNLEIFADSQLVVRQLQGAYQVKTPHLLPLWREARQTLQKFEACAISHFDRSCNHEADRLARQAIDRHQRKR